MAICDEGTAAELASVVEQRHLQVARRITFVPDDHLIDSALP